MILNIHYNPKAFISCSLREEDRWYIDWVEIVVKQMGFEPFGTIGKYSFSPQPIWKQMRDNIKQADCIVMAATPRYVQQDIHDLQKTGRGLSEMLHVELGMAVASDRPVMAFVLPGTHVGAFLPQLVQYIEIDPRQSHQLQSMAPHVANYFRSAFTIILKRRNKQEVKGLWRAFGGILSIIGSLNMLESLLSSNDGGENA